MNNASQRRSMYTAKTVQTSAARIAAERRAMEMEEWGTMDPSPARAKRPAGGSLFDWGIIAALVMMLSGFTAFGGMTILAAIVVVLVNADPGLAAANVHEVAVAPTPTEQAAAAPAAKPAAKKAPAAKPAAKKAPARKAPTRSTTRRAPKAPTASAPRAIPTQNAGEQAMSISQLKQHLASDAAPAPTPAYRPAPTPAAAPAPTGDDDFLNDLVAEPVPAAAPMAARPAPAAAPARAPVAPPANSGISGAKQLSSRLAKMPNGVLILDEPFDPVPVAIATDQGAAIYVDGELLGGAPLAIVLDRGSHEVTVQAEKGTASFELDASEGDKWCFSVKRGPKLASCK